MKKRWITAALTLSLCVSTQGITYAASTTKTATGTQEISYAKKNENQNIVTGKLENKKQSWTYNQKTHTLTIKGTGKLEVLYSKIPKGSDWDEGEAEISTPWDSYTKDITSVVIEDGITSVSTTRFDELPNLQKITLGKGIKKINYGLFSGTKVKEFVIPDTVTSIEDSAFYDCKCMTNLSIGAGVTSIDPEAFNCSYNLKTISLSEKNTSFSFENGTLMDKTHTTVYLALGDENHTVSIPSTVTYINPNGLEHVELKQITVDENNPYYTSVDGILYSKDLEALYRIPAAYNNTVTLPSQLNYIHKFSVSRIFSGKSKNLSKIVFGERTAVDLFERFLHWSHREESPVYLDVTKNHAFSVVDGAVYDKDMTKLYVYQGTDQEYIMPDTIVRLNDCCTFPNTCNLTSITLGANFEFGIGNLHTESLQKLQRIQVSTQNAIYSSIDGILCSKDQTEFILCPQSYGKNVTIPEGVKKIWSEAFTNMTLENITLPSTLENIDSYAFKSISGLKTIEIPIHTKTQYGSFASCTDLETIIWNSTVAAQNAAFDDCPKLTNLIIGPHANNILRNKLLTTVPNRNPYHNPCPPIFPFTNITLDEKNPNYTLKDDFLLDKTGKTVYAYFGKSDAVVRIPKGVTTIGPKAFIHSQTLKKVILPNSLETIEPKAFFRTRGIKTITFPKKVSKIGEKSFCECYGLRNVKFTGSQLKHCAIDAFQETRRNFTVYARSSSLSKLKKILKKCKITDKRYISRFKTFS